MASAVTSCCSIAFAYAALALARFLPTVLFSTSASKVVIVPLSATTSEDRALVLYWPSSLFFFSSLAVCLAKSFSANSTALLLLAKALA